MNENVRKMSLDYCERRESLLYQALSALGVPIPDRTAEIILSSLAYSQSMTHLRGHLEFLASTAKDPERATTEAQIKTICAFLEFALFCGADFSDPRGLNYA